MLRLTARPKISEVVQDTKILLQQSRERLVISYVSSGLRRFRLRSLECAAHSRVANDLSSYDTAKYKVSIVPAADGTLRFHLGEPIRVKWRAPLYHSRRDWIGIYRVHHRTSPRPY